MYMYIHVSLPCWWVSHVLSNVAMICHNGSYLVFNGNSCCNNPNTCSFAIAMYHAVINSIV